MKKTILIPTSGGMDSTYLIQQALSMGHDVRTVRFIVQNNEAQCAREDEATAKINEYFSGNYGDRFKPCKSTSFQVVVAEGSGAQQAVCWLLGLRMHVAALRSGHRMNVDEIWMGYVFRDDALAFLSELKQLWKIYGKIPWSVGIDYRWPKLKFPIRKVSKYDVYRRLDKTLRSMVSFCELGNAEEPFCGYCGSCISTYSELSTCEASKASTEDIKKALCSKFSREYIVPEVAILDAIAEAESECSESKPEACDTETKMEMREESEHEEIPAEEPKKPTGPRKAEDLSDQEYADLLDALSGKVPNTTRESIQVAFSFETIEELSKAIDIAFEIHRKGETSSDKWDLKAAYDLCLGTDLDYMQICSMQTDMRYLVRENRMPWEQAKQRVCTRLHLCSVDEYNKQAERYKRLEASNWEIPEEKAKKMEPPVLNNLSNDTWWGWCRTLQNIASGSRTCSKHQLLEEFQLSSLEELADVIEFLLGKEESLKMRTKLSLLRPQDLTLQQKRRVVIGCTGPHGELRDDIDDAWETFGLLSKEYALEVINELRCTSETTEEK